MTLGRLDDAMDPGRRARLSAVCLLALSFVLLEARPAVGLGLSPDPLDFSFSSGPFDEGAGSLDLLEVRSDLPAGASVALGSVAPGDVVLVFSVAVDEPVTTSLGLAASVPIGAAGTVAGPDADLAFAQPAASLCLSWVNTDCLSLYDARGPGAPDGLVAGLAYDAFFLSFPSLAPGDLLGVAACLSGGCNFGSSYGSVDAVVTPEPGRWALLALALGPAVARRRAAGRSRPTS